MAPFRWMVLGALLPLVGCIDAEPCPSPLQACAGICYDLSSEPLHCGRCGNACPAAHACFNGACVPNPEAACRSRLGGAFVTLVACGQAVKVWAMDADFIARAQALAADPASPGPAVPVLGLLLGSDCDDQWSWHASIAGSVFAATSSPSCDVCPGQVEADVARFVAGVGEWCPSGVRVVSVDERPAASVAHTRGE